MQEPARDDPHAPEPPLVLDYHKPVRKLFGDYALSIGKGILLAWVLIGGGLLAERAIPYRADGSPFLVIAFTAMFFCYVHALRHGHFGLLVGTIIGAVSGLVFIGWMNL